VAKILKAFLGTCAFTPMTRMEVYSVARTATTVRHGTLDYSELTCTATRPRL